MAPRPRDCGISREGLPRFGVDYDLERWAEDGEESGKLVWHDTLPTNEDWDRVVYVTLNFETGDQGADFRNYPISRDRPLDPYGAWHPDYRGPHKCGRYFDTLGPDGYYDLDNLALNALLSYGLWTFDQE